MRIHRLCFLLLCLLGVLPVLHGQAEPSFNIQFKTYPLGDADFQGLYYRSAGGEMQPVNFLRNRGLRSAAHRYVGESPLRFYRMQKNTEGVDVPVEVAAVALEHGVRNVLLMFAGLSKKAANGSEFHVFSMSDDAQRFPIGNVLFFNAYPDTLYISFGSERIQLRPGQLAGPFELPKSSRETVAVGMVKLAEDGSPEALVRNRWRFTEGSRELIILANGGKSDRPAIYQLTEMR